MVYAAAFSGFYVAMILVLASLFFRPVGFDYRSKIEDMRWRNMWDWGIFIGSFVPPLVIGVAFGNLLQGFRSIWMSTCVCTTPVTSSSY